MKLIQKNITFKLQKETEAIAQLDILNHLESLWFTPYAKSMAIETVYSQIENAFEIKTSLTKGVGGFILFCFLSALVLNFVAHFAEKQVGSKAYQWDQLAITTLGIMIFMALFLSWLMFLAKKQNAAVAQVISKRLIGNVRI